MYPWVAPKEWWLVSDPRHSCTAEQRNSVVPYIMGPVDYDLITDHSVLADTGFVSLSIPVGLTILHILEVQEVLNVHGVKFVAFPQHYIGCNRSAFGGSCAPGCKFMTGPIIE